MPTATSVEPIVGTGVQEVLRRHKAETAFQMACDVARSCFTEIRSLKVDLLDDPEEEDRVWVMLHVLAPPAYPWETFHEEELRFHKAMLAQIPVELNPLFGLHLDYSAD